jgi:hypothetical protein
MDYFLDVCGRGRKFVDQRHAFKGFMKAISYPDIQPTIS